MHKHYIFLYISTVLLSGCQSQFGPNGLANTHPAYNQSIVNTLSQEMLLNLVRLKYNDEPYFLTINSITASLSLIGTAGINSTVDLGPATGSLSPSLGVTYSDIPIIAYQPLQGVDYLKSVLSPIPLESLLVLSQSGWDIDRLFGLCIERINNISNAPNASGPTPKIEPELGKFEYLLSLLKEFQLKGEINIGPSVFDEKKLVMFFEISKESQDLKNKITSLLNLKSTNEDRFYVEIGTNFINTDVNKITMRTRSVSSLMYYLSQVIETPKEHIDEGIVNITKAKNGSMFNWANSPAGEYFNVKVSEYYPNNAFLAVNYRGYWFYIADNDLISKSTFMLLTLLFNLQAGQTSFSSPTLTIPVR